MYDFDLVTSLEKKFSKMEKRDRHHLRMIYNKMFEIRKNPYRYKNLHSPLQHLKRVHIDKHFVLTFSIRENIIVFEDFDHHDKIYKK